MKTCNQQRRELFFPAVLFLLTVCFLLLEIRISFCQQWNPWQSWPVHHSHLVKDTCFWFTFAFCVVLFLVPGLFDSNKCTLFSKKCFLHIKLRQLSSVLNWPTGPSLKHLNLFGCSGESEGTQLSASDSNPGGGAECSRLHRLHVCLWMQKMKVKQHKTLEHDTLKCGARTSWMKARAASCVFLEPK